MGKLKRNLGLILNDRGGFDRCDGVELARHEHPIVVDQIYALLLFANVKMRCGVRHGAGHAGTAANRRGNGRHWSLVLGVILKRELLVVRLVEVLSLLSCTSVHCNYFSSNLLLIIIIRKRLFD